MSFQYKLDGTRIIIPFLVIIFFKVQNVTNLQKTFLNLDHQKKKTQTEKRVENDKKYLVQQYKKHFKIIEKVLKNENMSVKFLAK